MPEKPIFNQVLQMGMVVKNLDQAPKKYWEDYGIGPWGIYTFDKSTVSNMTIRDQRVDYAMRLAVTQIGGLQWELIEPLDEKSIYAEFLKEHGEGLHHVAFAVNNYDKAMAFFSEKGMGILQGGTWQGLKFTYIETEDSMSCIAEIYDTPKGWKSPPPDATYP